MQERGLADIDLIVPPGPRNLLVHVRDFLTGDHYAERDALKSLRYTLPAPPS